MRPYALALCLLLFCFAATPSHAATEYAPANAQGCKVWTPLQRPSPNYQAKYTGTCKDGFASGKGHLDWVNTYASNRVTSTWDGFFLNGVYVGETSIPGTVEPQPNSNDYLLHLGPNASGDLVILVHTGDNGSFDICNGPMLAIIASPSLTLTDDPAVQRAMSDAATKLLPLCKTGFHGNSQVNIYNAPYKLDAGRHYPQSIASARIEWPSTQPAGYNNSASAAVRQQERNAASHAQTDAAQKRFNDFTLRNHITSWVTAQQLDDNPFKYQGKTVGLIIRLDRMLSPNTAAVSGARDDDGGALQLHNITPDFPDSNHSVLLAVLVGPREPIVGQTGRAQLTGVTRLDSETCTMSACYDWTSWARGKTRILWGEPYTPAP